MQRIKRVNRFNKKGLSPAIATALLISLALILAALIFIWANSFLKEKVQKFDEPIERACEDIVFQAEVYETNGKMELHVVNRKNVPIQSFDIRKKTESSIVDVGTSEKEDGGSIASGETAILGLPPTENYEIGDELIISPVVYGLSSGDKSPFVCEEGSVTVRVG